MLYFHGNADNLQHWGAYGKTFLRLGYDFMVWDYRGYGKSTGKPTAENMLADADLAYRFASRIIPGRSNHFIIYGRSPGTGLAAYVASRHAAKRLILETPYYSPADVAATYLPMYLVPVRCATNPQPIAICPESNDRLPFFTVRR